MTIEKCPHNTDSTLNIGSHEYACPMSIDHEDSVDNENDLQSGLYKVHSTNRIHSTIPRTGSDKVWRYPSPEMFYSAVKRKGHMGAIEVFDEYPSDLESIVHIHNVVNEAAWQQVLRYEKLSSPCSCEISCEPSLEKFIGRSKDWTIKARLNHYILGYQLPFDRHDWHVSRCRNGSKSPMKYIIDFYSGPKDIYPSIHLDVRPEPSLPGILYRLKMQYTRFMDFIVDKNK